jgi:predicted RNA binding protein YcfA (HicA-like mRNA interferase family)
LSSVDLLKILEHHGFKVVHQKGSHIKLSMSVNGFSGHVIIPNRKDLPQGTIRNIFKQASSVLGEGILDGEFKNL